MNIVHLVQDAEFWVAVGLVIFVGLLIRFKVPGMALNALDARAAKVQGQLDEALKLREEAEALLAKVKADSVAAERLAAEMIAAAEADAKRIAQDAQARLEEQIERRRIVAERRISTAEAQAAAEVKAAAADLAAELAQAVLAERLKGMKSDPLIDRAVEEIPSKLQ
jgi:F-type H+-transporting ATPase subunit b